MRCAAVLFLQRLLSVVSGLPTTHEPIPKHTHTNPTHTHTNTHALVLVSLMASYQGHGAPPEAHPRGSSGFRRLKGLVSLGCTVFWCVQFLKYKSAAKGAGRWLPDLPII